MKNNSDEVSITDLTKISTENKTNTADVTVMNESGNQSLTESAVMDEARVHSTPVSTRESNKTDDKTRNWLSLIHI